LYPDFEWIETDLNFPIPDFDLPPPENFVYLF